MPPNLLSQRMAFFSRLFLPMLMLILLLSLGMNAFFVFVPRPGVPLHDASSSQSSTSASGSSALGPLAFGVVKLALLSPRTLDENGVALKPVKTYEVPASVLPALPKELLLYRDQGIPLDTAYFVPFFRRVGSTMDPETLQLLPETFSFTSVDGALHVSFSAASRTLKVVRTASSPAPVSATRADDPEVIALARTFADTLGLDTGMLGNPEVIETKPMSGQASKTIVTWPMSISSFPVLSVDGSGIATLSVQVGRVLHRAMGLEMPIFSSDVLAASPYPVLPSSGIASAFLTGGMSPMPRSPKGEKATYSSARMVYMLLPQNPEHPTYLMPMLQATFSLPSDGPGLSHTTLIPVLEPAHVDWRRG